jgi:hypothetical protein
MRREPDFLEGWAYVCTILVAILSVADWLLKVWS